MDANSGGANMYYAETAAASQAHNSVLPSGADIPNEGIDTYEKDVLGSTALNIQKNPNRKIIWSADISIETQDFDASLEKLDTLINDMGGYVESSHISGGQRLSGYSERRDASFTVRIPVESFEEFTKSQLAEIGNITNTSIYGDDRTEEYIDTEARLASLKIQEERLLDILSRSTELSDVIELERALSDTRYQIESLTGTLRKYDSLVSFSTIQIYLTEVSSMTKTAPLPKSLSERISQQFSYSIDGLKDFGEDLLIFIIGALPVIIILAILVLIIVLIVKGIAKRSRAKKAKKMQQMPQYQVQNPAAAAQAPPANNQPFSQHPPVQQQNRDQNGQTK